ncbi:hypothetical protein GCM10008027_44440 [Pseudoalteromonas gelatinilytica]|uniref:Uncharacterized protein n=1 Tax=Pseudoalteromonas gelatinilytica TaxID=1703256 RepID=A0ABQ1UDL3_9GAMM|nr:hypothetical protein GCM10008027_44440 [Pseudoalteromonas profundi]
MASNTLDKPTQSEALTYSICNAPLILIINKNDLIYVLDLFVYVCHVVFYLGLTI